MFSSSMRSVRFGVFRCAMGLRRVRLFLIDLRWLFGFTLRCLIGFPSPLSESYYGTRMERRSWGICCYSSDSTW